MNPLLVIGWGAFWLIAGYLFGAWRSVQHDLAADRELADLEAEQSPGGASRWGTFTDEDRRDLLEQFEEYRSR